MKRKRQGNHSDHVNIANHHQEGSTSSMDGRSISNPYIVLDVDDDPYFPPFISQDPISDEKYAQQLQLHEALSASRASSSKTPIVILDSHASRASTSSSSIKTPIVILDSQASRASTSSSPKTPLLDSQTSRASTSSSPKTPIVILDGQDSHASALSSPKTPIVILDSQASRASTSSSPKTPIVILDSQASRASTSFSPKTPIVILDGQDSHAFESSKIADRFCDICMEPKTESEMFQNTKVCRHTYCFDCIRGHVAAKIQENITKVPCPNPNCRGIIGPEACCLFVPREVVERWEEALCESLIFWAEKLYCPFKDCSALLDNDGVGAVISSECPHCNRLFCARCKVTWHSGKSCRECQSLKPDQIDLSDPSDLLC